MSGTNLIAIIGPDGCGKTTIANELDKFFSGSVVHRAANFECIPTISQMKHAVKNKLFGIDTKFVRNTDDYKGLHSGMQQVPNSILKCNLLVVWYFFDYMLGYFELKKASKNREVFIFARYFYDYYFQISNKNVNHSLLRFLEIFIPKPQYVFYLHRNAEDIYAMKPELTIKEIQRQQMIIEGLVNKNANFIKIECNDGINDVVRQIKQVITG